MNPLIVINFKTYESGTGKAAVALAKKLEAAAKGYKKDIVFCVQNADLHRLSKETSIALFAQHGDAIDYGAHTGHDLLETLKENGASGVLINHAEDQKPMKEIAKLVEKCRKLRLKSLVCADKPGLVREATKLKPDMVALEIPELIGTLIAVSKVKPDVVIEAVKNVRTIDKKMPVLCGAGIAVGDDVKKAMEYGCAGVLVATAIMKSKEPAKVLKEFLDASF
jgi:triosephosphate isomerase